MKNFLLISSLVSIVALVGCEMMPNSYPSQGSSYQTQNYSYPSQGSSYQTQDYSYPSQGSSYQTQGGQIVGAGVVDSVRNVTINTGQRGAGGIGIGTIGGAALGGLAGSQIGQGTGSIAAAVGGAIAGGYIGHQLEQGSNTGTKPGLEITVRLDRGGYTTVTQDADVQFYRGDRVRLYSDGNVTRVIR